MRGRKFLLGALALIALSSGATWAQGAIPVKVTAKIESQSLSRAWGQARVAEIQDYLAAEWARKLGQEYRHWDFHTNKEHFYAMLTIKVSEPELRKIRIGMTGTIKAQGIENAQWEHTWLEPADFDLGRRPPANSADQVLLNKTRALFARAEHQSIKDWLRTRVPLGSRGRWKIAVSPSELRVVTSLAWQRFKPLQDSIFRLRCYRNDNEVAVDSKGMAEPDAYTNDRGKTYDALVVRPLNISEETVGEIPMAEVGQYEVGVIFLREERTPVDREFFSSSRSGVR